MARVLEKRLSNKVRICLHQRRLMSVENTKDARFALRMLMENFIEGRKELHYVFMDSEKAHHLKRRVVAQYEQNWVDGEAKKISYEVVPTLVSHLSRFVAMRYLLKYFHFLLCLLFL